MRNRRGRCHRHRRGAAAGPASAARPSGTTRRHARPALWHERRRRLLEHPASGAERPRLGRGHRGVLRRLPAAEDELPRCATPEALLQGAADVRRSRLRLARPERGRHPQVLQGRHLRREAERGRAHLLPSRPRRRDDRPRRELRRAAHLRQDARGHDVRARLRGRRGPPVRDGRAAPRGARGAVHVRRRLGGQSRPGPHAVGAGALYGGGPPAPVRPRRGGVRRGGSGSQGRRDELRGGNQRLHHRGTPEPARRCRASTRRSASLARRTGRSRT